MSISDVSRDPVVLNASQKGMAKINSSLVIAFAGTIFLSAFLLFGVQPMFTKMVLPWLGGSPAVWSVAMVFFQGLLLLGYLYAHLSTKFLKPVFAVALHAVLIILAFASLPLTVSQAFGTPPEAGQGFWLLTVFTVSVGLPFFVLSATAPLMQAWFARSGDEQAENPYFLYIASNAGSFAALIAYPLLIEPLLTLYSQRIGWMALFAVLGAGLVLCGIAAVRFAALSCGMAADSAGRVSSAIGNVITWRQRAIWTGLAAVPSGLLVAVTAHLSTDVGSAPFLWVMPLAVFMLTFIFAFRETMFLPLESLSQWFVRFMPLVIVSVSGFLLPLMLQFMIHITALFLAALLCHHLLYLKRPSSGQLTEFYLWMSFGGMIGGLFAGLLAPLMFNTIVEYRLLLIAALLCVPATHLALTYRSQFAFAGFCILAGLVFVYGHESLFALSPRLPMVLAIAALSGFFIVMVLNKGGQVVTAGAASGAFLAMLPVVQAQGHEAVVRSFFGVNYVKLESSGEFRVLTHGTTYHGAVRIRQADGTPVTGRPNATMYYHDKGAINIALKASRANKGGMLGHVAVLGLGAGALACQSVQGENWTFFEIDSEVVNLARNKRYFPFLSECTPEAHVVVGDARLTLQKEKVKFDTIILDAFSSDAVPAHLLTKEAFSIYADFLAPGGMIIAHVSNRYMDLRTVAEAAGMSNGLETISAKLGAPDNSALSDQQFAVNSTVVAMSHEGDAPLKGLYETGSWRKPYPGTEKMLWTDDYANVIGAIVRHSSGSGK